MHRNIPHIASRVPRGFTLLEIMLAMIIGSMVLVTGLATFALLQRADRHNERRLESATELAIAQRAAEMALRSMVLSNTRAPAAATPALPGQPVPEPASASDAEPAEFERPRVILSAEPTDDVMIWEDGEGRPVELRPQRLEITVERPPVFPEPLPGESFRPVVHRMYASRRERHREERREEREAEREGERDESPYDSTEPAIAAGVRGVFELTWEPQLRLRPGDQPLPEGGSWTLWWRTLPPIATIPDAERTEGLSDEELDANPMYRPVKLASNLRWCRWEAVRAGETLAEFQSTWWEDLPAYVTLELQTVSGKWSKWMFEVQGTRGPEPGSVIGGTEPPTENPEPGADETGDPGQDESGGVRSEPSGVGGPSRLSGPRGGGRR